ncbi:hypothetical protein PAMA_015111 [Pampus argenteus]
MPGPAASATNVGASSRSPSKTVAPRAAGSTVRQRKATSSGTRSGGRTTGSAGTGGMWRFYTEDSPGLKVHESPSLFPKLINKISHFTKTLAVVGVTTNVESGCIWLYLGFNQYLFCGSGPVPVLVMSLLFIASVFMLHIWGKYTRS